MCIQLTSCQPMTMSSYSSACTEEYITENTFYKCDVLYGY